MRQTEAAIQHLVSDFGAFLLKVFQVYVERNYSFAYIQIYPNFKEVKINGLPRFDCECLEFRTT